MHGYAGVDEDGKNEVEKHTAEHHQQSLIGRFGTEFPGLGLLFHLLGIHRFVNHACYLTVATERNPSDSILSVAPRRFVGVGIRFLFRFPLEE